MPKEKPKLFNREHQKEQSDKYKYKHIHTGEYCTFEAYMAEYLVLRRQEKLGLGKPAYKFWTKGDPLHWTWMKQLNAVRALVKKYGEEAVHSAIKSKDFDRYLLVGVQKGRGRGWMINPKIEPLVAKYKKIVEDRKSKEKQETIEVKENPETRKKQRATKGISTMNKLRGDYNGRNEREGQQSNKDK